MGLLVLAHRVPHGSVQLVADAREQDHVLLGLMHVEDERGQVLDRGRDVGAGMGKLVENGSGGSAHGRVLFLEDEPLIQLRFGDHARSSAARTTITVRSRWLMMRAAVVPSTRSRVE